jgi:DNA replicative helicase MCM subunit Mcm2 (Cdc46/Mcm family)
MTIILTGLQQHLADILEEGRFTKNAYGIYQEIDSPTTIIATTNPESTYWNGAPSLDQLPIRSNIRDRFDQTYIFQNFQTVEERRGYATEKMEIYQNPEELKIDYDFLKRYLQYVASLPDPVLTPEAATMLSDFWIRLTESGFGANRSLDSLVRISRAQARLHLKTEVDAEIVNEVLQDIQLMFVKMGRMVDPIVEDPRFLAKSLIIQYANALQSPITVIEAIKHVWATNNSVKQYLGANNPKWETDENKRLRNILELFSDGVYQDKVVVGGGVLAVKIVRLKPLTIVKVEQQTGSQESQKIEEAQKSDGHWSIGHLRGELLKKKVIEKCL